MLNESLALILAVTMCFRIRPVALTAMAHTMAVTASKAVAIGPTEERVIEAADGGEAWREAM